MKPIKAYAWVPCYCAIVICAAGCLGSSRPPASVGTPLPEQADGLRETAHRIDKKADQIKKTAGDGEKAAPAPQWGLIDQSADDIKAETRTLATQADEVEHAQARVADLEAQVADLQEQLGKATAGTRALEDRMWLVFMGIGALMILAAGPLAYMGSIPLAVIVGGSGLLAVGIGKFMAQWAWLVGLSVAAALVGLVAYLAWVIYNHRRHLLEVIRSSEIMKKHIPNWSAPEVQAAVGVPQGEDTQKLIRKMRYQDKLTDRARVAA